MPVIWLNSQGLWYYCFAFRAEFLPARDARIAARLFDPDQGSISAQRHNRISDCASAPRFAVIFAEFSGVSRNGVLPEIVRPILAGGVPAYRS
jgi:hypothetical protein